MKYENLYGTGHQWFGSRKNRISLRHSSFGGIDIKLNGIRIENVMRYEIITEHPFPRINLSIAIHRLGIEPGIPLQRAQDGQADRGNGNQGK